MEKEPLMVSSEVKREIEKMAAEAGLSADKLTEVLLKAFLEGKGKVFVGVWKEGPGIRVLPDWPRFSAGVMKLKEDERR